MSRMKELFMAQRQWEKDAEEMERRDFEYHESRFLNGLPVVDRDPGDEQQTKAQNPTAPKGTNNQTTNGNRTDLR